MTDETEALVGYYDLYQISSTRETKRTKEHKGILPFHPNTIMNWVRLGKFPEPVKSLGSRNIWKKSVIHQFAEGLKKEAP